jgi:hypothetical protein
MKPQPAMLVWLKLKAPDVPACPSFIWVLGDQYIIYKMIHRNTHDTI